MPKVELIDLKGEVLVDSHCHLDDERFSDERTSDILARALNLGVKYVQTIGTTRADFDIIQPMAEEHKNLFCSFGIHPHNAEKDQVSKEEVIEKVSRPKVIAIGETGLDYFYDNSPRDIQIKNFEAHLEAARETNLPVIIHTRDAEEDTISILDNFLADGPAKLLFHCFSSKKHLAEYAVEKGIYLSASGIVTFNKAEEVRAGFEICPLDKLLVETDAPYLAPVPFRGKTNEPAFTRYVLQYMASMYNIAPSELAKITTDNFFTLFSKAER